jgi:UDP-glucose 4-epimerase
MILVTGGAGFIGSQYHKKYGGFRIDDLSKGRREVDLQLDCTSNEFVEWMKENKPEHIIHLAGQSSGERSHIDRVNDFTRNYIATQKLLISCLDYKPKSIVLASSVSVYGNRSDAREEDRLEPLSNYGRHKMMAEEVLKDYCDATGVRGTSLRLFNVYGDGQDEWDLQQGMVSIYVALAKQGHIQVKGSGDRVRDFVHVDDVVEAINSAVYRYDGGTYEAINVGSGRPRKISEVVEAIAKKYNATYEYLDERTAGDSDFSYANILKAEILLDYQVKHNDIIHWV